jgi:hypothetical protein
VASPPQIFGGSPGTGFFGSSGSFVKGGKNTVSRSFFLNRGMSSQGNCSSPFQEQLLAVVL